MPRSWHPSYALARCHVWAMASRQCASLVTSPPVELLNVTITSEQNCSNLLAILNQGRLRRDHTCAPVGTLNIKFANGKTNEVHLLPTHQSDDAEFRVGVLKYKVLREKLYAAFAAADVDISKIPTADH